MLLKLLAVITTLGFGSFSIQLFFFPDPEVTVENTVRVNGTLSSVDHISRSRGNDTLQVWLDGHENPFRASSGYPDHFRDDYMLHLARGATVEIFVEESEIDGFRKDHRMNQEFRPICGMTVNREEVFTLQDFNSYRTRNTKTGRIVAPILTLCGLYLGWVACGMPGFARKEHLDRMRGDPIDRSRTRNH